MWPAALQESRSQTCTIFSLQRKTTRYKPTQTNVNSFTIFILMLILIRGVSVVLLYRFKTPANTISLNHSIQLICQSGDTFLSTDTTLD